MARPKPFEGHPKEDRNRLIAIQNAGDTLLAGDSLDSFYKLDTDPGDPSDPAVENWLETTFPLTERLLVAGEVVGWWQGEAAVDGDEFEDAGWESYLEDLVVEAAGMVGGPIDHSSTSLSSEQLAGLASSLSIVQLGIAWGRSEALKPLDLERARAPKIPRQQKRIGQLAVAGGYAVAGLAGLTLPGAAVPVVLGASATGGARAFQILGVEGGHQRQLAGVARRQNEVARQNAFVAALERVRDCPPETLDVLATLPVLKSLEGRQNGRRTAVSGLGGIISREMRLGSLTGPENEKDSEGAKTKNEIGKETLLRISRTAVAGFLLTAGGLVLQHTVLESDSGPRSGNPPVVTPANNTPVSPELRVLCNHLPGDDDGDRRTPDTVKRNGATYNCPPGS